MPQGEIRLRTGRNRTANGRCFFVARRGAFAKGGLCDPVIFFCSCGVNLLCFFRSPILAPHFFFSLLEKKKRAARAVQRKREVGCRRGRTVLLSRTAQRGVTLQPVWCKTDTAKPLQPLPLVRGEGECRANFHIGEAVVDIFSIFTGKKGRFSSVFRQKERGFSSNVAPLGKTFSFAPYQRQRE